MIVRFTFSSLNYLILLIYLFFINCVDKSHSFHTQLETPPFSLPCCNYMKVVWLLGLFNLSFWWHYLLFHLSPFSHSSIEIWLNNNQKEIFYWIIDSMCCYLLLNIHSCNWCPIDSHNCQVNFQSWFHLCFNWKKNLRLPKWWIVIRWRLMWDFILYINLQN